MGQFETIAKKPAFELSREFELSIEFELTSEFNSRWCSETVPIAPYVVAGLLAYASCRNAVQGPQGSAATASTFFEIKRIDIPE